MESLCALFFVGEGVGKYGRVSGDCFAMEHNHMPMQLDLAVVAPYFHLHIDPALI